ncbi:PD-(D/E)XK nuclease family protein [Flavobacterium salilacus subsp. salilacus]|uniref:PD-(D/E)XK nuclease family protein n=1 Tax=Flavobacterium TaxID=237 RepID=UPI0010752820|nr:MULTISPECIES: PD-(D/E)XK nuclease family protein [Flavobacterium]KAF2518333.1 PD-(D/E)XK nuclease family protein [Flavobacterium salilacus subsp. salilacus]MBE1615252.1 PD-(D/E)XK nuclease family protein [Flavobacterium sp. SaA2.13]
MLNETFLDKLSSQILSNYGNTLSGITIVLPNKRARIFLIEALKRQLDTTVFAPEIISIEDFVQDVAGIRSIDTIELLFEFYTIYLELTPKEKQQPFESFANWAKTLLQDFNEIDRYLLPPEHVFSYLKDIEDIKHWSLDLESQTEMIKNYLEFWALLPKYYDTLYRHLKEKGAGYQGLIYREAVANISHFSKSFKKDRLIFAGFNALNAAEEHIIQHLMTDGKASIYWDIDRTFLNDPYHDAGLFIRRFQKEWKQFTVQPFEWISDAFSEEKNIQIIGTPKTVGQAKIAGKIVEQIQQSGQTLDKTALVLGEENMLVPMLYSLPNSVGALNITMGYSSRNNPAQILVQKLFKMHTNALNRSETSYTLYYREVLDVLNHPLVEPYLGASKLVDTINRNNITFFSLNKLFEIQGNPSELFNLLFERWDTNAGDVLQRLSRILVMLKSFLSNDDEEDKITKAFLYSIFKVINKLINYYEQHPQMNNLAILQSVYKQVVDLAEVSFEGEPLSGLQVMGVLESRVLDFDNVIITSMNEGKFPAGKTQNSFIPYDVKRELGLPTYKEKDAIYSYHFYHLLMRAKNIYLLYNTESEGLDAGERSRFLTQLEIEKKPSHNLQSVIYNANLPQKAYEPMVVPKSAQVQERLKEIATGKGFSPSALTGYIRNPMQFYYQRVLRIYEVDEVEESIALNTLGTIIHGALEALYKPYINKFLTVQDIEAMAAIADEEVMKQFTAEYKEGEIKKGRNLLAFEVAKRNVHNLLKQEKQSLKNDDAVKVLALEEPYERWLEDDRLPYAVKIAGNIDRIEQRNGKIRIIDYKTGKVDKYNLVLKTWEGLTADIKHDKIIQLLTYVFMYEPNANGMEMEAGIISFKNMKSGFMNFSFKEGAERNAPVLDIVDTGLLEDYKSQLVILINEILNAEVPFEEVV